ncbi:porin [Shimia biformata]|uniref:porin n=1 Tax=Shimia biformata TaxID=1294299 RepID=UPI0019525F70|nr:porin [Shimia biformata]
MKRIYAGLAALPLGIGMAQTAAAEDGFRFYGFVNPAIVSFDDGATTTTEFADSSHAPSRIGIWWERPMSSATFKFNFETALGFRGTSSISQTTTPDIWDWDKTKLRKIDAIFETSTAGTFSVGQGSMATDGVTNSDLSGTSLTTYNAIGDSAGGFFFRTSGGALSTVKVGSVYPNFDGSRKGRLRYDSPDLGGLTLSASVGTEILSSGNDDVLYDVAARYAREFGSMKYVASAGVLWNDMDGGGTTHQYAGTFSALHMPSGFNVTVAAGQNSADASYIYGKLGVRRDFFAFGTTSIAVDYYMGQDNVSAGDESDAVGIGIVQEIDSADLEVYFGFRQYGYADTTATTYQDANSYLFGARWKF